MRKLLFVLLLFVSFLGSILLVRTLRLESKQITTQRVELAPVDTRKAAEELSGAIQFQTISYEDRSRIDGSQFLALHDYLEETFPAVHEHLEREKINGLSLLYTWKGSDPKLKPALLMAHLDVVPVEEGTESDWTHPAYSGAVAEGFVWGRGSLDDKVAVISILHAVEGLAAQGYQPRRTLYVALGHDEEIGGDEGAKQIAERLAAAKVELELVIDEGGGIIDGSNAGLTQPLAVVGIAEKGAMDMELTTETLGGHSSIPTENSAVGVLSQAIVRLENNPVPGGLRAPMTDMLAHLGPELPFSRKILFANLWMFGGLVERFFEKEPTTRAMLHSTTAATVFHAGDKANVLPSKARAVVNFRILPGDSVESVTEYARWVIDDERVQIRVTEASRNPSKVSSLDSAGWATTQRSIRELYPGVVVLPCLLVGGTDSKHFTSLTDSVYRFAGFQISTGIPTVHMLSEFGSRRGSTEGSRRVHGTDERISLQNLEKSTQFFIRVIRNTNEVF